MKTKWSSTWKESAQPRKQRKYQHNAPQHVRRKLVSSHLEKKLREKYSLRALQLRRGDEVKIVRGKKKGIKGKVAAVKHKKGKVYIEGQARESPTGKKTMLSFDPSNLIITNLKLGDKLREKVIARRSGKEIKFEAPKEEKKEKKPAKKKKKPEVKKEEKPKDKPEKKKEKAEKKEEKK